MKKRFVPQEPKNRLPMFLTAAVGLGAANLLINIGVIGAIGQIASKPAPRLVESPTGVTRSVVALEHSDPTPESIRQFVASTLYCLYDWRGILPPETAEDVGSPKPDPGVAVVVGNGTRKITTATWRCGFRLSDEIRKDILTQIALITPQDIFTDSPTSQTAMTTPSVGVPQKVDSDRWKVDYKGLLMTFSNGDALGDQLVREHDIYVRVIDPLLPVQSATTGAEHISDMQQAIFEERQVGLVIESMPEKLRN